MDYSCLFTVRVEKMAECSLEFDGYVAGCEDQQQHRRCYHTRRRMNHLLYKYSLLQDGSYSNEWKHQCPENKEWDKCYLTDAGDVILHDNDNHRTCLFDEDMQLMESWQYQGYLCACLPGPRTVYAVKKEKEYVIDIRNQDGEILQPKPEGSTWRDSPNSVCEDERTKKLVVVEGLSWIMDIFLQGGKLQHILYLLD